MDIEEALERLRIPWGGASHRHGRPGWVQVDCPQCGLGSSKLHCGINRSTGGTSCWRCGRLRLWDVLLANSGGARAAVAAVWRELRWAGRAAVAAATDTERLGQLVPPAGVGPLLPAHQRYLAGRGLDPAYCTRVWGAAGLSISPRLAWRIYIPVTAHGRTVCWTTRTIGTRDEQKYMAATWPEESEVRIDNILYGADYCYTACVVHEGPLDVWRTGPGATCLFGLRYSPAQVRQIARYPVRAICLDAEPDAQRVARRLARELAAWPGDTYVVELETGKDAGSAEEAELQAIREQFLGGGVYA